MKNDEFLENLAQVTNQAHLPSALSDTATEDNARDRLYLVYRILAGRRAERSDNWITAGEQNLTFRKLSRDIDHLLEYLEVSESPAALRRLGRAIADARITVNGARQGSVHLCRGRDLNPREKGYLSKVVDTSTNSWTLLAYELDEPDTDLMFGVVPRAGKLAGWATAASSSHGRWATVAIPSALHTAIADDPVNGELQHSLEISSVAPGDRPVIAEQLAVELNGGVDYNTALGRAFSF